jgi:hypothetical protein
MQEQINSEKALGQFKDEMQKEAITSRQIMTLRVCKQLWYASGWFFTQDYVVCKSKMRS